jgi:hypothetical protein
VIDEALPQLVELGRGRKQLRIEFVHI